MKIIAKSQYIYKINVPQECDKKWFRREWVPPDERNSNSNLRTKDSSDSEPTFDPNLGKNNVNDLEFCIDDNEKPKIQTDMDVDFVKKRNIKFKAKEEAKDIDEEEETSYKIWGEGDKQRESDRHNRNNGFKRELNKNKSSASRFVEDSGDDIF